MDIGKIRLIEELAANAWPPEIEQHLGGWRLRYTGGTSRRVNSVWPNAAPGVGTLQEGVELAEGFYRRWSALPCFQLCPAVLPPELPQALEKRGYRFYANTQVQVQSISSLLAATSPPTGLVSASNRVTDEWFRLYTSASGYSLESLPVRRGILSRIGPQAYFVSMQVEGQPAATGLGVVERGWLGAFCVVTAPPFRRIGLAGSVMHALADWGKVQGAENVYLQVMENNTPALNLYRKLAFTPLYQYYYAVKDGQDEKDY